MRNVTIVCATPKSQEEFSQSAPLSKFITKHHADPQIDHSITYGNKTGLPEIYNGHLQCDCMGSDILIFTHDDVSIEDDFLVKKLNAAMEHFDIVGLAGGSNATIKFPTLWHLMTDRNTWSGAVAHRYPNGDTQVSSYGPTPRRCLMVDGLFIAVNTKKIKEKDLWFDPKYSFHHYDLQFGIDANGLQLKTGTWPIFVVHSGLGDSCNTPEWHESERLFLKTNT